MSERYDKELRYIFVVLLVCSVPRALIKNSYRTHTHMTMTTATVCQKSTHIAHALNSTAVTCLINTYGINHLYSAFNPRTMFNVSAGLNSRC
jgi:hypothetical protein